MPGDSFIGCGKDFSFTFFQSVLLEIGIMAGIGGLAFGFPMICVSLRNPDSGSVYI